MKVLKIVLFLQLIILLGFVKRGVGPSLLGGDLLERFFTNTNYNDAADLDILPSESSPPSKITAILKHVQGLNMMRLLDPLDLLSLLTNLPVVYGSIATIWSIVLYLFQKHLTSIY